MNTPSSASRVIVIGAGIFGVSSAVHLARLGAEVTLVTEAAPANGASGRSLSWLNSARDRSPDYHRLRMIGLDRYRTLAATYPDAPWLRFDGGLTWDADNNSNGIAAAFAHERRIGYDAQFLTADRVAAVTPGVNTAAIPRQGAIFNPGEGWVDLPSLIAVLLEEFAALGGRLMADAGRADVAIVDGRATGVTLAQGKRLDADAVLLAAGPAVPGMVAKAGKRIGDATPISLLVKTKPVDLALRAVLNTPRVAIRRTAPMRCGTKPCRACSMKPAPFWRATRRWCSTPMGSAPSPFPMAANPCLGSSMVSRAITWPSAIAARRSASLQVNCSLPRS
jgi:glycine/D-amino acid oxidase-like deaminating enzyme